MKSHWKILKDFFIIFAAFVICVASLTGQESQKIPSLPLPDVTDENIMISNWRSGFPVPNSIRAWHYNPELVMPLAELGQAVQNPTLDYRLQMMMAAVVSSINGCLYCLCSSAKVLNGDGRSDSLLMALQRDFTMYEFDSKEQAALVLAEKLTSDPSYAVRFVKDAVDAGWKNEEVAQIIFFVSYMNMMNRIALAFDLPPDTVHPYDPEAKLPMLRCE